MKKVILTLIAIVSLFSANAYSYRYEIYDEPTEYVYDDEYVVYEDEPAEAEYVYEAPVYYRRPVVRERVVYREPRTVYVNSNPGSAIASGLFGFAAGTALGAAISN